MLPEVKPEEQGGKQELHVPAHVAEGKVYRPSVKRHNCFGRPPIPRVVWWPLPYAPLLQQGDESMHSPTTRQHLIRINRATRKSCQQRGNHWHV